MVVDVPLLVDDSSEDDIVGVGVRQKGGEKDGQNRKIGVCRKGTQKKR